MVPAMPEPAGPATAGPLLVPEPRAGAGVAVARALRLAVAAEGLVLTGADGSRQVLCPPGQVHRIVHVERHAPHRLLDHVLIVADGRAWALPLPPWTPGALPAGLPLARRQRLGIAGIADLAQALDTPLILTGTDPTATLTDVAGVDVVTVLDPGPRLPRWLATIRWSALGLAIAGMGVMGVGEVTRPTAGPGTGWAASGLDATLAKLLIWVPALWLAASGLAWWLRQEGRAGGPDPWATDPDRVWRPRPAGAVPARLLHHARLRVTTTQVCLRDADGREAWMPGPTHHGVTQALLITAPPPDHRPGRRPTPARPRPPRSGPTPPTQLQLAHADGTPLAALDLRRWAAAPADLDQLARLLSGAGIPVRAARAGAGPRPVPLDTPARSRHLLVTHHDPDTGLTKADVLAPLVYLAVDVYAFAAVPSTLLRALALAPFLPHLAALAWRELTRRRLDRPITPPGHTS